jgi:cytoskeletal protein RodZ
MQSSRTRILISVLAIILLVLIIFVAVKSIDNHDASTKATVSQSSIKSGPAQSSTTTKDTNNTSNAATTSAASTKTATSSSPAPLENTGPGNVGEIFVLAIVGGYIVKRTLILAKSR